MRRRIDLATTGLVLALLAGAAALDLSGHGLFVVTGSSMEPSVPRGALVIVRPTIPATLAVGDIVTYHLRGQPVTHRIAAIDEYGDARALRAKGDANAVADPDPVAFEDRAGLLVARVPLATSVTRCCAARRGRARSSSSRAAPR
ncbi:MAG: signal peptidase I [Chloroflexi bacterium]|nr:signal peptidase I [Chloroflexota bacterium]